MIDFGWIRDRGGRDIVGVQCSAPPHQHCSKVDLSKDESERLVASLDHKTMELAEPFSVSFRCGHDTTIGRLLYACSGNQPKVQASGWWLRFFDFQAMLPSRSARHALTACYVAGYRTLDEIKEAADADLEDIDYMGPRRVDALRAYLDENSADAEGWRDLRRVADELGQEVERMLSTMGTDR